MRRIIPIIVIGFLIISGFNIVIGSEEYSYKKTTLTTPPIEMINKNDGYIQFSFNDNNGETGYLLNPGQPIIPRILKVFELPFGVHDISIDVTPRSIKEIHIKNEIKPAPHPQSLTPMNFKHNFPVKDENVYGNPDYFPYTWYSYNVGCGINSIGRHVTYVVVYVYPIRYSPPTGSLKLAEKIDIKIGYKQSDKNWFPENGTAKLIVDK